MDSESSIRPPAALPSRPEADLSAGLILPAVEILDTDRLRAEVEAAATGAADTGAARNACVALLRTAREQSLSRIGRALETRPFAGLQAAASISWVTDQVVLLAIEVAERWLHPLPHPTRGERMAVMAVGGYGRAEMAPHSDVDLLFLTPYKQTPWGESMIESVLYILWDLKLKIGHSARTVDDCLRLGSSDITIRTALLELRFLTGDRELADELDERLWSDLFRRTGPEFVEAKLSERANRHKRQGGSRYLVEPNVKESKGGLRDLQTLYWIAKYLYHADTPEELVAKGVLAEDEVALFNEAEAFLWAVRCHMHFVAGRAVEQLTFDMQVDLAERFGFEDTSGRRAVENFMQLYFTHAKRVGELTRIFCAELEAQHVKSRPHAGKRLKRVFGFGRTVLPAPFVEHDGRVDFGDGIEFEAQPILLMRIFQVALQSGMLIHPGAFRVIAGNLDLIAGLREQPEANRIFLDLLSGYDDTERALRRLNETGALGAFMPEFGRIVALMQFNMYHSYTVDEHTILAVSILARIERGEMREELPLATDIMRQGIEREVIYLALLLHDIGKGQPGDHSEVGARIARVVCPRLGCDESMTEMVEWLVRHHLLLSDFAQRRDINDARTVEDFARIVQSPERLRKLLVLTACDIMAVGPGTWNNWKAQLLRQLYHATRAHITGDADTLTRRDRIEEAKAALAAEYGKFSGPDSVAEELERHYSSYWLGFDTETQLLFARVDEEIMPDEVFSQIVPDPARGVTKAAFYMEDHPGIFSRMAGALSLAGANVVDARCFTTTDGYVTCAFWIQDNDGMPYEAARLDRLQRSVERTLKGEVIAAEEFRERDRVKKRMRDFTVPTRIIFDNEGSEIYSIIEVSARDRPGLLYDLTRVLAGLSVSISSAVIATYGETAVDVFYVKDVFGLKLHSEHKRKQIEDRLRAVIDGAEEKNGLRS